MQLITLLASKAYKDIQSFQLEVTNPISIRKTEEISAFLKRVQSGNKPKEFRLQVSDITSVIKGISQNDEQKYSYIVYRANGNVANNQMRNYIWANVAFVYRDPADISQWYVYAYVRARLDRYFMKSDSGFKLYTTGLREVLLEPTS